MSFSVGAGGAGAAAAVVVRSSFNTTYTRMYNVFGARIIKYLLSIFALRNGKRSHVGIDLTTCFTVSMCRTGGWLCSSINK